MNGYPRFGWVDILRFQHDVYGKGYVESLTEKERASIATEFKERDEPEKVQESIPDIPEGGELWL